MYKVKYLGNQDNNDFIFKYGHETCRSYIFLNGLHVYFSTIKYNVSHWTKTDYFSFHNINGVKIAEIPVKQTPEELQDKINQIIEQSEEELTC